MIDAGNGIINQSLMVNLNNLALFLILIVVIGRVTPWELGLKDGERLNKAVSIVFTTWLTIQMLNVIAGVTAPLSSNFNSQWTELGVVPVIGIFFGHLFGKVLFEELVFRGFLMVQLIKRFEPTGYSKVLGIMAGMTVYLVTQLMGKDLEGLSDRALLPVVAGVLLYGTLYSVLYLLTDNLYLVIGFRTLVAAPTYLFDGTMTVPGVLISMIAVSLFWQHFSDDSPPLPLKVLTTERLRLRPWQISDAKDMFDYARSELVGPSAGWAPHESLEDSKEVIRHFINTGEVYAIVLQENDKVIGSIGIHEKKPDDSDPSSGQREIGYVLNPAYWGNGYMPEAVEEVKAFCFHDLGIKKLWCGHFLDNMNSKRVIEKCGFTYCLTKESVLVGLNDKKAETMYYVIEADSDDPS